MIYISKVPNHEGLCFCTWRNSSRLNFSCADTGFFRLLKKPFKEFHGAFYRRRKDNKIIILTTEGK